ncbi:MAG: TonB-dependent receptor [Saprospiraceae bacterium]|nr:TonB-dependent receptor [Saprospiraceae bacterium]
MKNILLSLTLILLLINTSYLFSQSSDSTKTITLDSTIIRSYRLTFQDVKQMPSIHGTYITSGKKNEIINVKDLPANIAEKTGRQIFAKIPGAFIYDMDGSGNQMNFATRGLDPHRSWEYNVRQNNIMINSDIYGYPASHYSPPMESIQKIEIVRGGASLQYGSQFGGMINYITKAPDTTKMFGFESINSAGSFGLLSSYNAIGGKVSKLTYYAYYQKRISEGYRDDARSTSEAQYLSLLYDVSDKLKINATLGRSTYLYQIPGALTDAMFYENPRQATRVRNYFSPDIYIPSLTLDWKLSTSTELNWTTSGVYGNRSSVQFLGFANMRDTIEASTLAYKSRQVDIDNFNSFSSEIKLKQHYQILKYKNSLVAGFRWVNNSLHRRQLGVGTKGTDYDLSVSEAGFGRDIYYKTKNYSFFVENLIHITPNLEFSPGLRYEYGNSDMTGRINYLLDAEVPKTIKHNFPLLGISAQYSISKDHRIYANWSQAYRPVIFADIIPASILEKSNPNMKDAFGYNTELGFKGNVNYRFAYDITFFQMLYKNRTGSLILKDENNEEYIYKTNIGDSRTNGIELYAEYKIIDKSYFNLSCFTASSYFDARYLNGTVRNGTENTDISNNKLETVPQWMSRNGIQVLYRKFSAILQYSFVDKSYSDALNTITPNASGTKGIVPAYSLFDLNMSYRFNSNVGLRLSLNNLTDKQYFTKRPSGYPGQGVWSSDGRSAVATITLKL